MCGRGRRGADQSHRPLHHPAARRRRGGARSVRTDHRRQTMNRFARLIDVAVGCLALAAFMLFFHVAVSGWVLLLPLIVLVEMLFAAAIGMLLSAANVGWRDVSRGLPLVLFLMLYAVPVLYSPDRVPATIRPLFDLNPMAHLVDAFRAAVLGTHAPDLIGLGVLALLGVFTLLVAQRLFSVFDGVLADVI